MSKRVAVIISSVREPRVNPAIAEFVCAAIEKCGTQQVEAETVDLADWDLPLRVEEPKIPAHLPRDGSGTYQQAGTNPWSQTVASFDAFVFVMPQYNWGYPAALKNAIDRLYYEWKGKPAMVVSYGGRGGGKGAAQLRGVLAGLRMQVSHAAPELPLKGKNADGEPDESGLHSAIGGTLVDRLRHRWIAEGREATIQTACMVGVGGGSAR